MFYDRTIATLKLLKTEKEAGYTQIKFAIIPARNLLMYMYVQAYLI